MKTVDEFAAKIRGYDDEMFLIVACLRGARTYTSPEGNAAAKVLKAEVKRRRMGGQVARFLALAKAEADRMDAETTVQHLPDGSEIHTMPGGGTITARWVKKDE